MPESDKQPYIVEPQDQSAGRPATFIFIHGYGDDAEGLPLGLAQQFQWHNKLPYLRWVLPNAPMNQEAFTRAWYLPKALPNGSKPRVPGQPDEDGDIPDDEEGILRSCATIDAIVKKEIDESGVDPERIVVGGFSQGCVVSLAWGLLGEMRNHVGGVFCASGYFALQDRIAELIGERGFNETEGGGGGGGKKKWLYVHGSKDVLCPARLFVQGKKELRKWVAEEFIEEHLYEGMGHSTCNAELRDLLLWLGGIIPP